MIADKRPAAHDNTINTPQYSAIPLGQLSIKQLSPHITVHMLWRVLKRSRMKYHLTANQLIMINGIYIYSITCKAEFTLNGIQRFVGYYNNLRTKKLLSSLIELGCIVVHASSGKVVYYRLTPYAYDIAIELFNEYEITVQKWYSKFNLSI
jgi:predicted transcriptional regulator with HTH domain